MLTFTRPDVDMWIEAFEGKYEGTRPKFERKVR